MVAGRYWVWVPAFLFALAGLVVCLNGWDRPLFLQVNGWSRVTGDSFWAFLTILSDGVVSFALLLPWIRRRPENIWAIVVASIGFTVVGLLLKQCMGVDRPPRVLGAEEFNLIGPRYVAKSFPSGHTSMIMTMVGVWSFTARSAGVRLVLLSLGMLVAASRVVVGVHWPVDVLFGASLGWLLAWVGVEVADRVEWGYSLPVQRFFGVLMTLCAVVLFFPYTQMHIVLWEQRLLAVGLLVVGVMEQRGLWAKGGVASGR